MLHRHTEPISTEAALAQVKKQGDGYDVRESIDGKRSRICMGVTGLSAFALGASALPLELQVITAGAASPLIAATYSGYGWYASRRAQDRLGELHNKAAEIFNGESVDIFRVGNDLAVRWYGLDDPATIPISVVAARSRQIISTSREHSIDRIVVNDYYFSDNDSSVAGSTAIGTEKSSGRKRPNAAAIYYDGKITDTVQSFSIDEFEEAISVLEHALEVPLLDGIIQRINDSSLSQLYDLYKSHSTNKELRSRLTLALRNGFERLSGETEVFLERNDRGVLYRQRASSIERLHPNGSVESWLHVVGNQSGQELLRHGGRTTIARNFGYTSVDELLLSLATPGAIVPNKKELLAAAYLLVLNTDNNKTVNHTTAQTQDISWVDNAPEPILNGAILDRNAHPRMRISLKDKLGRAAAALVFLAGYSAGSGIKEAADGAYDKENDRFMSYVDEHAPGTEKYNIDPALERQYLASDSGNAGRLDRAIYETEYAWQEMSSQATAKLFEKIIHHLPDGVVSALAENIPSFNSAARDDWLKRVALNTPPDLATSMQNQMSVGDVGSTNNMAVYAITSLDGTSTEGYWYTSTHNELQVSESSFPIDGASIEFGINARNTDSVELPYRSVESIMARNPSIMVETPYIGIGTHEIGSGITGGEWAPTVLPVLEGFRVVGAAYVDAANPDQNVPLAIAEHFGTGATVIVIGYKVLGALDEVRARQFEQPVLRYWLEPAQEPSITPLQPMMGVRSYLKIDNNSQMDRKLSQEDVEEIARDVRKAMGLPESAGYDEIYKAVRERHTYSFTPFKDTGKDYQVTRGNDIEALVEYGAILDSLPSLNCNMAATLATLATLDKQNTQVATGFREGDDDKMLSTLELHAWLIDEQGNIIDATPSGGAGVRTPPVEKAPPPDIKAQPVTPEQAGIILGGAILAAIAYRRRKWIGEKADASITSLALGSEGQQEALDRWLHERYGKPGSEYLPKQRQGDALGPDDIDDVQQRYIANIPKNHQFEPNNSRQHLIRAANKSIRRDYERKKIPR